MCTDLLVMTRTELSVFDFEGHLTFNVGFPSSSVTSVSHAHGQVFVSIVQGNELKQYSSVDWRSPKTSQLSGLDRVLVVSSISSTVHYVGARGSDIVIASSNGAPMIETTLTKEEILGGKAIFTETHFVLASDVNHRISFLPLTSKASSSKESSASKESSSSSASKESSTSFTLPPIPSAQSHTQLKPLLGSLVAVNGAIFGPKGLIKTEKAQEDASSTSASSSSSSSSPASAASNDAISTFCGGTSNKCFITIALGDHLLIFIQSSPAASSSSQLTLSSTLRIANKLRSSSLSTLIPTSTDENGEKINSNWVRFASIVVLETGSTTQSAPSMDAIYLIQRKDWQLECGKSFGVRSARDELFWRREESMAETVSTLVVELPAKVHDSLMKEEAGMAHLVRRWTVHVQELWDATIGALADFDLRLLVQAFEAVVSFDFAQLSAIFHRQGTHAEHSKDEFGFAKLLIATTRANTVVCYHSLTRSLMWSTILGAEGQYSHLISSANLIPKDTVISQIDSEKGPIITVLGYMKEGLVDSDSLSLSGKSFSISIYALTGRSFDFKIFPFTYKSVLTPFKPQRNERTPLFFIDQQNGVFLDPSTAAALQPGSSLRFYLAQRENGALTGYKIDLPEKMDIQKASSSSTSQSSSASQSSKSSASSPSIIDLIKIEATETWQLLLGAPIDALVHNEVRTISPGKVVGVDRSVLPKYLNPNAIAVATTHTSEEKAKSSTKESSTSSSLQVTVIDSVTGNIIHRLVQRGAIGSPDASEIQNGQASSTSSSQSYQSSTSSTSSQSSLFQQTHPMRTKMVFYDDWLVFSYWSTRSNRFELMSVELFEENTDNFVMSRVEDEEEAEGRKWSSQPKLNVQSQTFILMGSLRALAATKTLLGISVQDILVVYQDGKTSQISIKFLDPRRPLKAEDDPTLAPYYAYIPLDGQTVINYYSTIARVQHVKTQPSALESSSIVWLTGLDSFVRLIAQKGQSFDRLSHDYSFLQIGTICIALGLAAYVLKSFAKRKEIKEKWK